MLYYQFKDGLFDQTTLSRKGKRKQNGHLERRGKQSFKRKSLSLNQERVRTLFQQALSENSIGLLRKDELPKEIKYLEKSP